MIGQAWQSEKREFQDAKTGRAITQLTGIGNNVHLYFTENSFDAHKNEIIFMSDRASGEDKAPHEDPVYNIFRMNLDSGEIAQLTDSGISLHGVTKTPDSQIVVFSDQNSIKRLDPETGKISVLYEETGNYSLGMASIAPNRRYVAFCRNERVEIPRGPNYSGFKEMFYATKDARVTVAYLDGSGAFDAFKDTHWLGHFQFCPT
jgi:oligogalacturonide lyase